MDKSVITVVGKDTVGIIAKSMHLPGQQKNKYPRHIPDHRAGFLQHDDDSGHFVHGHRLHDAL